MGLRTACTHTSANLNPVYLVTCLGVWTGYVLHCFRHYVHMLSSNHRCQREDPSVCSSVQACMRTYVCSPLLSYCGPMMALCSQNIMLLVCKCCVIRCQKHRLCDRFWLNQVLLARHEWDAATSLCRFYGLDTDSVLRWVTPVGQAFDTCSTGVDLLTTELVVPGVALGVGVAFCPQRTPKQVAVGQRTHHDQCGVQGAVLCERRALGDGAGHDWPRSG